MDYPSLPQSCALEVSYACNHACPYCSSPWSDPSGNYPIGNPLNVNRWVGVIKSLAEGGVSNYTITGGEPTLLPEFGQLTAALATQQASQVFFISTSESRTRQYPVSFTILTNGDTPLWTRAFCRTLVGARCRIHVHVAGPPSAHSAVTEGNYDRTLRTIQFAVEAGVEVVLNVPIFRGNVNEIAASLHDVIALGVRHVNVMRILPVGRAGGKLDIALTPGEFARAYQDVSALCGDSGVTCGVGSLVPTCSLPPRTTGNPVYAGIPHRCGCGTSSFCIDPAGLVRPCTCSATVTGSIANLESALNGEAMQAFTRRQHPPACSGCPVQGQCSGGCPAIWHSSRKFPQGDPWAISPSQGGFPA